MNYAIPTIVAVLIGMLVVAQPDAAAVLAVTVAAFALGTVLLQLMGVSHRMKLLFLAGLVARFLALVFNYLVLIRASGGADTQTYYRLGGEGADRLIRFETPQTTRLIPGTGFIDWFSSFVQVVVPGPPMAVGAVFAFAGWLGCVLLTVALLESSKAGQRARWWFTAAMMFLPSAVLWTSIQGKDSLIVLGAGLTFYAVLRPGTRVWWLAGVGVLTMLMIRPHVAVAVAGALAMVIGARSGAEGGRRANPKVFIAGALVAIALPVATSYVLARGENQSFVGVTETISERSEIGGSSFSRPAIASPAGIASALPFTYLRPLVVEAGSPAIMLSALESTGIAIGIASLLLRRRWLSSAVASAPHRASLILVLSGGLMLGVINNFGLLVRQRVLFELCLVFLITVTPIVRQRHGDASSPEREMDRT